MSVNRFRISGTPPANEFIEIIKNLNAEEREKILIIIEEELPDNFNRAIKRIRESLDMDVDKAHRLFFGAFSNYITWNHFNESIEEFLDHEIYNEVRGFMEKILSMDKSIGILSKSLYLEFIGDNLEDSSIITDIRPIFYEDPLKEPKYSVLMHTLDLRIFRSGDIERVHVNLNKESLRKLSRIVERALNKEKTLTDQCKKNNIKVFEGLSLKNE
jgi:hypothetical protein